MVLFCDTAEGAADRREPLPMAAAVGAAAKAPAAAPQQRGPVVPEFGQPMVWWLARFAPDCGARDRVKTDRA